MDMDLVLKEMIDYDAGDARRIQHFLKVYLYAGLIGRAEQLPEEMLETLETVAILHDIGIHAAEEKYGSAAGKYQEIEGPAPARALLERIGCPEHRIERVCYLIAHHHTYGEVDGPDYQILIEADFLVNAYEDALSPQAIAAFREKCFQTESGKRLLDTMYGLSSRL